MRRVTLTALASLAVLTALAAPPPASAQETEEPAATPTPWIFPQEIRSGGQDVGLHEPTVIEHDVATGAITLRVPLEARDPQGRVQWGAATVKGTAGADMGSALFRVDAPTIEGVAVPGLAEDLLAKLVENLPRAFPEKLTLRLELITARPGAVPDDVPETKLNRQPPEFHVRKTRVVLVQLDGKPEFQPVKDFPIEYVVNTAADLFRDRDGTWYFLLDGNWATAAKLSGPWKWLEDKLPVTMTQLPSDHPRGHVRRWIPGTRRYKRHWAKEPPPKPGEMPEIIVSRKPAELVMLLGDPLFTLIPGVKLMVVANTQSDLFFHPRSGAYYLLIGGRWFQSEELESGWGPAFGDLPPEFAAIPRDHPKAHALSCVPGTPEAHEAIARARLPERLLLRSRARPRVRYEGKKAATAPIEGSEARRVTNTEDDVFKKKNAYFACVRGAWFRSDDGRSKWTAVEELPAWLAAELPAPSGLFHVNFCRPLAATEEGAQSEITGEYRGTFLERGAPVYGTGWSRRGDLRNKNWYPCARTYGENRWYDPISGSFLPRSAQYEEDGRARTTLWNPYTASYGRVRVYADRYRQGGRRMFAHKPGDDKWDLLCVRSDVHASWDSDVLAQNGVPRDQLPLGDRASEPAPEGPAVVCDAAGNALRLLDGKVEAWKDGAWAPAAEVDETLRAQLTALDRIRSRPELLRVWAAKRRAPLPINPVVTPAKKPE